MIRKTIIALAAVMAAMLTIPTTNALARGGGGGHGGGHGGSAFHSGGGGGVRLGGGSVRLGGIGAFRSGFHRGFFPRRAFVRRAPFFGYGLYASSCWRWVPTGLGLQRVWVCGGPYYPYF
jgi:hypothetical protein